MKKVVITGASGFLGKNLIRHLQEAKRYELFALTSDPEDLRQAYPGVHVFGRGLIGMPEAKEVFSGAVVINCAFPRNTSGTERAEGFAWIRDFFAVCAGSGIAAMINISSQSVYSVHRERPAKEDDPVCLDTVYAALKYASEILAETIFGSAKIPYTNIRLASLIGPGFDVRIVNRLARQAKETGKITVTCDRKLFGFMDVADAAAGLSVLIDSDPENWRTVYNLGTGTALSLETIAETVKNVLAEDGIRVRIDRTEGEGDENTSLDPAAFYGDFGFMAELSPAESVRRILAKI